MKNQNYKHSGFTLIELSIVLVIIGLIVGGVLLGRELIFSASVRAQIRQIEEIETQMNTFRTKYNCLPGDCINATAFFGTVDVKGNTVNNGNGDGIIKSTYGNAVAYGASLCLSPDVSGEVSQLFLQMFNAGLSPDYAKGTLNVSPAIIGREYPYARFGNGTGIYVTCLTSTGANIPTPLFLRTGNIIVIGGAGGSASGTRLGYNTGQSGLAAYGVYGGNPSTALNPIGIPVDVLRMIDDKIDDGKPSSGKFGIVAGQTSCDNALSAYHNTALLTAYPGPSTVCNATAGKRID